MRLSSTSRARYSHTGVSNSGCVCIASSTLGSGVTPFSARSNVRALTPRSGMLCFGSPGNLKSRVNLFFEAMRQLGYVEGRNVRYEMRYGNGQRDLLLDLATELVAKGPDVIVSGSTFVTPPLMQATKTIPIVMVTAEEALATSRQPTRPAPNVTGTVNNALEQVPRSFQLT